MKFKIQNREISGDGPAFIVAEISANHLQNYKLAVKTIEAIKKSGADAVKVQTYTPDTITFNSTKSFFRIKQGTIWDGQNLYELYKTAYMPWEWQPKLQKVAKVLGLVFFSSPFDKSAVDFLERMNVPAYKIAAFEITDIPLIRYVASKGKPVIISTGIARLADIREAVRVCRSEGNNKIILLKCTSAYPAPVEDANLKTIADIAARFKVMVGLSDHTLGITLPIAAVALGAHMIEKHFTLDKKLGGPDAAFSLEPQEFAAMVKAIREVESALGKVNYTLSQKMLKSREFCRSLFIVEDLKKGDPFSEKNIRSIRPGFGLPPKYLEAIIGKKAARDLKKATPLAWEHIVK
jgi:pseudaminic acid synthase